MTCSLNKDALSFSYTREQLFTCVKNIISQDRSAEARALAVFCVLEDYLANFTERGGDGEYYIPESDSVDFLDFVRFKLGVDNYSEVSVDEILG